MVCVIVRLRRCFVRIDCLSAGIGIGLAIVAAAARSAAGLAAGRRTVIHLIHSLELLIRDGIRGQVAGTDYPGFLVIIVVSTVDLLSALGGHFVDIAVLIGVDIQGTGTVGSGLALEVDEVDVGIIIIVSEVLVVLGVVSQVQLALTSNIYLEVSNIFTPGDVYIGVVVIEVNNSGVLGDFVRTALGLIDIVTVGEAQGYLVIISLRSGLVNGQITNQILSLSGLVLRQVEASSISIQLRTLVSSLMC